MSQDNAAEAATIEFCGRLSALEFLVEQMWIDALSQTTRERGLLHLEAVRRKSRSASFPPSASSEAVDRLGMGIALEFRRRIDGFVDRLAPAKLAE